MSAGLLSSVGGSAASGAATGAATSGLASGGFMSGLSSGLGQTLGTTAAGTEAGSAAATTAGGTTAGSIGSAIGSGVGTQLNKGAGGDIARMFTNGGETAPVGTGKEATAAADPSHTKGGWLGTGLFGNDQYNPNPSSYQPATGNSVAQAAAPRPKATTPIAMQLMQQLPITDPSYWRV